MADCNQSLRLAPHSANTLDSRGFTHLRMNDFDSAISGYEAALKLSPRLGSSMYGLGLAKRAQGDTAAANSDIAAAMRINPGVAAEFKRYGFPQPLNVLRRRPAAASSYERLEPLASLECHRSAGQALSFCALAATVVSIRPRALCPFAPDHFIRENYSSARIQNCAARGLL